MPSYCDVPVLYFSASAPTNVSETQKGRNVPMQHELADRTVERWHCRTVRVCPPKVRTLQYHKNSLPTMDSERTLLSRRARSR